MTRFLHSPQGEPPRRLPRARPRLGLWIATLVAIAASAGIVVAMLAMTPSVASGDGVTPESGSGYGTEIVPPPASAPEAPAPDPSVELPAPTAPAPTTTVVPTVPTTSARFEDLEPTSEPAPTGLRILALGIDAEIVPVGYAEGEMEVPATASEVGWYEYGPAPGSPGSSVLAAHVAWRGEAGVFFDLVDLPSGSTIEVQFEDGSVRYFESVALTSYDKESLPVDEIFRRDGPPVLTLITCGGAFNPSLRSYEDNIVAFAVEITDSPAR